MNKSHSEPVSISHVTAYSQSDSLLHENTIPHKNSVINFKAYLIDKQKTCTNSEKVVRSQVQTINNQGGSCMTQGSMTQVFETCHTETKLSHFEPPALPPWCNTCHTDDTDSNQGHDMVLRVKPKEDRVDIEIRKRDSKRDSAVSVPYAKPNKCKDRTNCGNCAVSSTKCADEYYFSSNLSDKMSDYEDIWKYADPKSWRVPPSLLGSQKCSSTVANSSFEFHRNEVVTEKCQKEITCVKDLNVSLEKLNVTKQCSSSKSRSASCSQAFVSSTRSSEAKSQMCKSKSEINIPIQHYSKVNHGKDTCQTLQYSDSKLHCHPFNTIHEQDSDIDQDSNHSDSCRSDRDAEADTEDCEDEPSNRRVRPQTTRVSKQKSRLKGPWKSVSTSSLSTTKTPEYSVPFDSISPEGTSLNQDTKVIKKRRRQSAPVLSLRKSRHPSTECNKLSPVKGEETKSDANDDDTEEKSFSADNDLDKSTDCDEIFSLELKQPKNIDQGKGEKEVTTMETKWVENKLFSLSEVIKTSSPKISPKPQKPKTKKRNLFQQAVMNDKFSNSKKMAQDRASSTVIEHFQFLEDFDDNSNPSSPTVGKFPVHSFKEGKQPLYDSTCVLTAEDIITLSNPDLALHRYPPFPISAPQSEYDNLNGPYIAPSGQSMMSNGTVFQPPWEQGMVAQMMKISNENFPSHFPMSPPPEGAAPPPLPTLDPKERIKQWQESSQKYAPCVQELDSMDREHRRSLTPECSPQEAVSFEYGLTSILDHEVSSNGKNSPCASEQTIVNDKSSGQVGDMTDKHSGDSPRLDSIYRERIMTNLGNYVYESGPCFIHLLDLCS